MQIPTGHYYWTRHPDGPFVTLIEVAATHLNPEMRHHELLRDRARRNDEPRMRRFKAELREAIQHPERLPEGELEWNVEYNDADDMAFMTRLWKDLYGDEPVAEPLGSQPVAVRPGQGVWRFRGWQAGPDQAISLDVDRWRLVTSAGWKTPYETCVVFLLGYPGVGKRTLGSQLADLLGGVLVDNQLVNVPLLTLFSVCAGFPTGPVSRVTPWLVVEVPAAPDRHANEQHLHVDHVLHVSGEHVPAGPSNRWSRSATASANAASRAARNGTASSAVRPSRHTMNRVVHLGRQERAVPHRTQRHSWMGAPPGWSAISSSCLATAMVQSLQWPCQAVSGPRGTRPRPLIGSQQLTQTAATSAGGSGRTRRRGLIHMPGKTRSQRRWCAGGG